MNSIYLIIETYTNGYIGEFLDILSLISIIFGLFILISKNPIVSVLFLIFLFSSVSIYLIMLGINFIRISYLLSATGNSIPLAIIITISFYYPLSKVISYNTVKTFDFLDINPRGLGDYFSIITQIFNSNIEISYATSKN